MLLVVLLYVGRRPQTQFALHFIIFLQEANVAAVQRATKKSWKETGRNQKKKVLSGDFHIFSAIFKTKKPMPIAYNLCILSPCWMAPFSHRGQLQEARRISARTTERTLKERQKRLEELRQKQTETCSPKFPGTPRTPRKLNMSLGWRIR